MYTVKNTKLHFSQFNQERWYYTHFQGGGGGGVEPKYDVYENANGYNDDKDDDNNDSDDGANVIVSSSRFYRAVTLSSKFVLIVTAPATSLKNHE